MEVTKLLNSLSETPYEARGEAGDLRVNAAATDAQLAWSGHSDLVVEKKVPREDLDVFEATFNAACLAISSNKLAQAGVLLKRARRMDTTAPSHLPMPDVYPRTVQRS